MYTVPFVIFFLLSIAAEAGFTIYALLVYRRKLYSSQGLSPIILYTIGVFLAVLMMFLPIYYFQYSFGDFYTFLRPLLLAVHNTMRVFILDGEFDIVRDAMQSLPTAVRVVLSTHAAILYVLAPIMTFGNVLSLFQNFQAELRYRYSCRNRPLYIMSELNRKSLMLARDIMETKSKEKPVVVFTDVYPQKNEESSELYSAAGAIHAICLSRDVSDLDIFRKKGNVEIFLLGSDESENVGQAVKIIERLNHYQKKQNVKLFVFALADSSAYTLESQRYNKLLDAACEHGFAPNTFKLRRINEIHLLAQRTVPKMELFQRSRNGVISVMLAGMGKFGMEFFKMLIWYCQVIGYKLEINIFVRRKPDSNGNGGISAVLRRNFPELMQKNPCSTDGDANYDIKCYEGVDFETDTFERILAAGGPDAERLLRTTHIVVALGKDETDIEISVYLRRIFDQYKHVVADPYIQVEDEDPAIYAVVYHEQMSTLVHENDASCGQFLINQKEIPYHIQFIGSIYQQYTYHNICDSDLEQAAYAHHISWAEINRQVADEMRRKGYTEQEIRDAGFGFYTIDANEEEKKYERFEYFRESSISRELHDRMLEEIGEAKNMICTAPEKSYLCTCPNCDRRKKTEHMRWNAYMLVNGYSYGARRADRAKIHYGLVPWSQLTEWEKAKD